MATTQRDHAVHSQAWNQDFNWEDPNWNGIDLTQPSPTCDGETLGESIRRVGNDFFDETQDLGSLGPNKATYAEAKDLMLAFPASAGIITTATTTGLQIRAAHEDPLSALMEAMEADNLAATGVDSFDAGRGAVHPIGDINPRYASLVGDSVGGAGGAVVGRVTTTTYGDDV